ncbi:MAG: response regulator, partial [Gemmatimonadota bacterium]
NGIGIDIDHQKKIFGVFERLHPMEKFPGTGIGLAIVQKGVERMGGRFGVESEAGKGSRFWIELPRSLPPEPSAPAAATHVEQPTAPQADTSVQFCVLFIEDNLANVRLMERVFMRRPNVRLLTAMQGSLGLDLAREHRPDMVLLDVNLPDMSGEKVLLQLRQDPELRSTPVVMISGDAIPSRVERVLELGARAYITKPFNIQDLLTVVDETLDENSRRVTRQGATTTS